MRRLALAALAATLLATVESPLAAQSGQRQVVPRRATVALVDSLPTMRERYAAVILRTPGPNGRDVILLPRASASGELLDAATRTLLDLRARQGERATHYRGRQYKVLMVGVKGAKADDLWTVRNLPFANVVVEQLLSDRTRPRNIPHVGHVPALVFLPPHPTA